MQNAECGYAFTLGIALPHVWPFYAFSPEQLTLVCAAFFTYLPELSRSTLDAHQICDAFTAEIHCDFRFRFPFCSQPSPLQIASTAEAPLQIATATSECRLKQDVKLKS